MLFFLLGREGEGGTASVRRKTVLLTLAVLTGLAPQDTHQAIKCYSNADTAVVPGQCAESVKGCAQVLMFDPLLGVIESSPGCGFGPDGLACLQTEIPGGTGPCTGKTTFAQHKVAWDKCNPTARSSSDAVGFPQIARDSTATEVMHCECATDLCNDDNFGIAESGAQKNTIRCRVHNNKIEKSEVQTCKRTNACASIVGKRLDFNYEYAIHICGVSGSPFWDCISKKYPGGDGKCTGVFHRAQETQINADMAKCAADSGDSHFPKFSARTAAEENEEFKLCRCEGKGECNADFGKDFDKDEAQRLKDQKDGKASGSGSGAVVIGWGILAGALVWWLG